MKKRISLILSVLIILSLITCKQSLAKKLNSIMGDEEKVLVTFSFGSNNENSTNLRSVHPTTLSNDLKYSAEAETVDVGTKLEASCPKVAKNDLKLFLIKNRKWKITINAYKNDKQILFAEKELRISGFGTINMTLKPYSGATETGNINLKISDSSDFDYDKLTYMLLLNEQIQKDGSGTDIENTLDKDSNYTIKIDNVPQNINGYDLALYFKKGEEFIARYTVNFVVVYAGLTSDKFYNGDGSVTTDELTLTDTDLTQMKTFFVAGIDGSRSHLKAGNDENIGSMGYPLATVTKAWGKCVDNAVEYTIYIDGEVKDAFEHGNEKQDMTLSIIGLNKDPTKDKINATDKNKSVIHSGDNKNLSLKLKYLTITGGKNSNGGGLYLKSSKDVNITNCIFDGNEATSGNGGGIFVDGANCNIISSTIKNCTANRTQEQAGGNSGNGFGGGIYFKATGKKLSLTGCIIDNCRLTTAKLSFGDGGGIYVSAGNLDIIGNVPDGAIIQNCFANNGGGFFLLAEGTGVSVKVENALVKGNTAKSYGGGFLVGATHGGTLTGNFENVKILENSLDGSVASRGAGLYFGGGYSDGSKITFKNAEIKSNDAKNGLGGGLYISPSGSGSLHGITTMEDNTTIAGNTASEGAGVYVNSSTLEMSGSAKIDQNDTVYMQKGSKIDITKVLTGEPPVATIKLVSDNLKIGYPLLQGSSPYTLTKEDCSKFKLNEEHKNAGWKIVFDPTDKKGKLLCTKIKNYKELQDAVKLAPTGTASDPTTLTIQNDLQCQDTPSEIEINGKHIVLETKDSNTLTIDANNKGGIFNITNGGSLNLKGFCLKGASTNNFEITVNKGNFILKDGVLSQTFEPRVKLESEQKITLAGRLYNNYKITLNTAEADNGRKILVSDGNYTITQDDCDKCTILPETIKKMLVLNSANIEGLLATQTYAINFSVDGGGGDLKAKVDGSEITTGAKVAHSKEVTFTATPNASYVVDSWTGITANPANATTAKLTVDGIENVSIKFLKIKYNKSESGDYFEFTGTGVQPFKLKKIEAVSGGTIGNNDKSNNQERQVSLDEYYIGETEVTQGLYEEIMGYNPSFFKGIDSPPANGEVQEKRPVEYLTWYEAVAFCNELTKTVNSLGYNQCVYYSDSAKTNVYTKEDATNKRLPYMDMSKKGFRLPTEAEWEWAAQSGSARQKYAGTDNQNDINNYSWNTDNCSIDGSIDGAKVTHEVGKKIANSFGLYDMSGNVNEWCWDWYADASPTGENNPTGAPTGEHRAARGGAWNSDFPSDMLKVYYRDGHENPVGKFYNFGFRIVCRP